MKALSQRQTSSPNASERKRLARILRRDERIAAAFARRLARTFAAEERAVLAAFRAGLPLADAVTVTRWEPVLEEHWLGSAMADIFDNAIRSLGVPSPAPGDLVGSLAMLARARLHEVYGIAAVRAEMLVERTRRDLAEAVSAFGVRDAKASLNRLVRREIRAMYRRAGKERAARIAVTETLQATATAQHLAVVAAKTMTGGIVTRKWNTVGDDNVRESHVLAHGQTREDDLPFDLAGGSVRFPRDPLGPPGEVINCRCWETYTRRRRR